MRKIDVEKLWKLSERETKLQFDTIIKPKSTTTTTTNKKKKRSTKRNNDSDDAKVDQDDDDDVKVDVDKVKQHKYGSNGKPLIKRRVKRRVKRSENLLK